MKLFGGILVLLMGIAVSLVAAWFSVTGMVALFNANAIGVLAMMVSLEAAKLVSAGWLKFYWKSIHFFHRTYMLVAVVTLSAITSLGIYGYLSAGHLEQTAPRAQLSAQAQPLELQVQQKNDENARLQQRLTQIDQNISVFLKNDQASKGLRASNSLKKERDDIQKKIDGNDTAINDLNTKLGPLKQQSNEVEAKLGPIKYLAAPLGWNEDAAVRFVILLIMSVFDPLAVVMLLSAMVTFRDYYESKQKIDEREPEDDNVQDIVEDGEKFVTEPDDAGFDVVPYDSEPLDLMVGDSPVEALKPLNTEPPRQPDSITLKDGKIEGSRFTPDTFTFSLGPVPATSLRSFDGFPDWYRKPVETKKEEPTFKVLELPGGEEQPAEVLPDPRISELEQTVGSHKANIDALERELQTRSAESESTQAKLQDVTTERDQLAAERSSLSSAYAAVTETLSKLSEQHRDLKIKAHEEQQRLTAELWAARTAEKPEPTKEVDRETLIAILERHPGILNEIEQMVEHDVVEEMSDREKLLDLLEKNPSVINDMAEIIATQITGR